MIRNIMSALAFVSIIATGASAQTKTANNVTVGTASVQAWYPEAEFVLNYCGEATIEIDGHTRTFDARVCPTEPGVWLAEEVGGSDYVKVFTNSGTVNAYIRGENRVFTKQKL